jgi:hypothetical protein
MTAVVNYIFLINSGEEIGIFFAFAGTSFTINTLQLTANILSWL